MHKAVKGSICFISYKSHLKPLYKILAKELDLFAVVSRRRYSTKKDTAPVRALPANIYRGGLKKVTDMIGVTVSGAPVYVSKLPSLLKQNTIDVVVVFDMYHWYTLQALRYVKKNPSVKLILCSETKRFPKSFLSRLLLRFFMWRVRKNADVFTGVWVYTKEGVDFFAEYLPEFSPKIIPAPVDTSIFVPPQKRQWLPNKKLRILMNARYESYKRHEDLIKALVLLREQNLDFHLTLIGRADNGKEKVEQLVNSAKLHEYVTFLDTRPIEEVVSLYHEHDVLVLPSYNEAIGMVVPEAMACGTPTITSDTVGANVYVKENVTGFIFKTGDVDGLLDALKKSYHEETLSTMSEQAIQHCNTYYSNVVVTKSLVNLMKLF